RLSLTAWALGCSALAAFVVAIIHTAAGLFGPASALAPFLRGFGGNVEVVLVDLIWFAFAQMLIAVLAITYVSRWSDDDTSGWLAVQLAQPVSRLAVTAERMTELLIVITAVSGLSSVVVLLVAAANHITLSPRNVAVATALLIPFGMTFAAAGATLGGWRPRIAVGVLSTVAVLSYLLFQLAPTFRWPSWASDLSVFQLYGTPLINGVFIGGLVAMLAICVVGFPAAAVLMLRRDVAH
ncbi:MAG TPA: hypothetical protein VFA70_01490, partial [Dehalococcoidia bacterium]|nr:hypothetical protein [Dehalococcoidia bacterium]